ncbi:MAG TPA: hypothetical protein VGL75_03310 [Acidothermaceae bacterium]
MHRRMGPPDNELPGTISFHAVLGRTDELAIALVGADAYSNGLSISIALRLRHNDAGDGLADMLFGHHRRGTSTDPLLVGVSFPDGRTATNVPAPRFPDLLRQVEQPEQLILVQRGGGGGGREFGISFWITPLPPPGDLTIVVAWPSKGIAETHTTIPADLIAAGVARSVELWPWEPPGPRDEPPAPELPELPAGGWFAEHAPDAADVTDGDV